MIFSTKRNGHGCCAGCFFRGVFFLSGNWRQAGLAVLLMLLCAVVASPAAASSEAGHGGFYLNATLGPAGSAYEITGSGGTLKVSGGAATLDLRLGGAVTDHLILSAVLSGTATVLNPDVELNGTTRVADEDFQLGTSMAGVGFTYYFDSNLFIGADVGVGEVDYMSDTYNFDSDRGYAAQIRFGKEWWMSDNWALGIVGGVKYMTAKTNASIITGYSEHYVGGYTGYVSVPNIAHFDRVDASTVYVAFTISYN